MKHFIFSVLVLSSLFFSSCSSTNTSSNQENERLDKLKISTTNDKVAYSIGYTSAGELVEFVNSPQYGKYFSAVSINDGFFQGLSGMDTVQADACDATLAEYFKTKGSFDTTKIRPKEASHCLGFFARH